MYRELMDLRDAELREWNSEASCGLRDPSRMLYRCQEATSGPYHAPEDGPCEVWTPNFACIDGHQTNVCDTCRLAAVAAQQLQEVAR